MIWPFIPANRCLIYDLWLWTYFLALFEFCSIDELNHRVHCLNFERWTKHNLELLFPRNYWTVIPERTFERWFEPIFPRHCWLERSFELWSSNPVTFVGLRNGRFPAYVLRDSVCFELSVHMYTYLRSRIWTIYFRNLAFVLVSELTSGVSDLLSQRNLNYLLPTHCLRTCFRINVGCFRFTFAAEFELIASEALPSYMFPIYLGSGIWAMRFRCNDFVPFPTPCFRINFVVLLRSYPCFEHSRFLGRTEFSEKEQ